MGTHHFACPIHGSISVSSDEKSLIDHKYFQRLRNIKQLGLSYLVYPNATHSRFAHSIGVMHLAGKLADALLDAAALKNLDNNARFYIKKVLRIAGLFHDLGHGPLSHFFEHCIGKSKIVELDSDYQLESSWFENEISHQKYQNSHLEHEHISVALIRRILVKNQHLAQDICSMLFEDIIPSAELAGALRHTAKCFPEANGSSNLRAVFKFLLSGELDADRLDYLQRDSHFSGVKISSIDVGHIINSVGLSYDPNIGFYIRVPPSAVSSIEQVLISRRQMFNQVYLHRTCFLLGKMLEETLQEYGLNIWPNKTLNEFVTLSDESFLQQIFTQTNALNLPQRKNVKHIRSCLFARRIPLRRITERFIQEANQEQYVEDLQTSKTFADSRFFLITPKEFTKLDRDQRGADHKNSHIRVEVANSVHSIPLNNFSEVFTSTLWRTNVIRLLVVKNEVDTAEEMGLFDTVSSSEIQDEIKDAKSSLETGKTKSRKGA